MAEAAPVPDGSQHHAFLIITSIVHRRPQLLKEKCFRCLCRWLEVLSPPEKRLQTFVIDRVALFIDTPRIET
jgi:hypothetical protein